METRGDSGAWTALVVSYVVNPLVLPPVLLVAVLAHFQAPGRELAGVGASTFVFFTLLPLAFLIGYARREGVDTLEVRDRARRNAPYIFALGCGAAALAVLYVQITTARSLLLAIAALLNVNAGLLFLINARLKISIHAAAVAGFVGVLLFVTWKIPGGSVLDPVALMWLIPAVPGVMWARIRSGAHSLTEVIAGAAFGALIPAAELWLCIWSGLLG